MQRDAIPPMLPPPAQGLSAEEFANVPGRAAAVVVPAPRVVPRAEVVRPEAVLKSESKKTRVEFTDAQRETMSIMLSDGASNDQVAQALRVPNDARNANACLVMRKRLQVASPSRKKLVESSVEAVKVAAAAAPTSPAANAAMAPLPPMDGPKSLFDITAFLAPKPPINSIADLAAAMEQRKSADGLLLELLCDQYKNISTSILKPLRPGYLLSQSDISFSNYKYLGSRSALVAAHFWLGKLIDEVEK
jgi:hypothetical protein